MPRLLAHVEAAGLRVGGWLQASLYEPTRWLQPCTGAFASCAAAPPLPLLRDRLAELPPAVAAEAAELLNGHIRKHWTYLVADGRSAAAVRGAARGIAVLGADRGADAAASPVASPADATLACCPANLSTSVLELLDARAGQATRVQTTLQGAPLRLSLPPSSGALLRGCDCRRPLADVLRLVAAETGRAAEQVDAEWRQLYAELVGLGWLTLSDCWQ